MRLRFAADRRTLFLAFVLFPLGPLLAFYRPALLPWLAPLLLYNSYLSGVLAHNHGHVPIFRSARANIVYGAWLSIFYGFPIVSWLPTHNRNHHVHRNGPGDITATSRHAPDGLWAALTYPCASSYWQLNALRRSMKRAFSSRFYRTRLASESTALLLGHAGAWWLAVHWHGVGEGSLVYAGALGLPALTATYWMMLTNYLQHVGCDSSSPHDHSRNFVSPLFNWFVFENGYHTVHHEHPTTHWSQYRKLHEERASAIAPELNQSGTMLSYLMRRYLHARRPGERGRHRCSQPAP